LQKAKRYKMDKQAIKDITFGGLVGLMRDRRYYYHSSIGLNYCHFTEEGTKALSEYMSIMCAKLHEAEEKELDQRAKDMVVKGLKGEKV
jgi:hypothetical protein